DPSLLPAAALQRLVALSHGHSQECGFVPDVKPPAVGGASRLVWECVAGHSFSWGLAGDRTPPAARRGDEEEEDSGCRSLGVTSRRRSLRRAGVATESRKGEAQVGGAPQAPDGDQRGEAGAGGDDGHPGDQCPANIQCRPANVPLRPPNVHPTSHHVQPSELSLPPRISFSPSDSEPQRRQTQLKACKTTVKEEEPLKEPSPTSSSPSEEKTGRSSWRRRGQPSDEEVAQISPKRIRKAAKKEILLCDFEGCGKIFSNRQYLNHHKKYQHVHQKTFTCSEPSCGKSFNFKKHLKEHEKLHSDKRDYICEFCARSFRTSSNLIIHRRIHTGEKPLQCEICGFTCRQKASLNWHMKKHDAAASYRFSCDLCGKKFEKKDNVTAHKSKSHPEAPPGTPQTQGGPGPPPPPLGPSTQSQ
ncbi:ZN692 protein, partial [Pedionomus torquatus]|nr:ZN692 protein [Pedionomus torquatus]